MNIIALDLGSNMALAHNVMGEPIVSSIHFEGVRAHRLCATMKWVAGRFSAIKELGRVDLVALERPFARGLDATRSGWGIAGIIEAVATHHGWPCTDTDPQTIKKFATGKGVAEKPAMIAAAQRLGYQGDNEHEADAFLLLKYAEVHATVLPSTKGKRT